MEGMALMQTVNPGYVAGKTEIPLADVAKYCGSEHGGVVEWIDSDGEQKLADGVVDDR